MSEGVPDVMGGEFRTALEVVCVRLVRQFPGQLELDDLKQEGFLCLLEALPTFDPDRGTAFSWSYSVVRNGLQNYISREFKIRCVGIPEDLSSISSRSVIGNSLHLSVDQEESFVRLWRFLSPLGRAILLLKLLHYPNLLTNEEASRALNIDESEIPCLASEIRNTQKALDSAVFGTE